MPRTIIILAVLLLLLCLTSCEKTTPNLSEEYLVAIDDIPMEYGTLIAVSSIAEYPDWFQLWFQNEEGTIRVVRMHFFKDKMHQEVKTITRS